MAETRLFANGIDGVTGNYILPPMLLSQASAMIKGQTGDKGIGRFLRQAWARISERHLGLSMDVDPTDVGQAGWAIVFHRDESPAVKEALAPLIAHRTAQAGALVKVLEFRPGDDYSSWLARHGVSAGNIIPRNVPYYVLLVGDPELIPYGFQCLLDVDYAVGRIAFDTPEEYGRYAASLIDYETAEAVPTGKTAVFFGARHDFDNATQLSADLLINPLADGVPEEGEPGAAAKRGFETRKFWGPAATKANLRAVLCGDIGPKRPSFLFTASHGMGWPKGHPDQFARQGALLCQDWPGFGKITPDHYLAASDVPPEAKVHGLVAFHFACYGAGTPRYDNFVHEPRKKPPEIAPKAFVAALPRRLLAHENGGALAVIGHVERAWGYSFTQEFGNPQLVPFRNTIGRILLGMPVGYATKEFNEKYAELSAALSRLLEEVGFGAAIDDDQLAIAWTQRNDAQNYVLLGDPAARLRVAQMQ